MRKQSVNPLVHLQKINQQNFFVKYVKMTNVMIWGSFLFYISLNLILGGFVDKNDVRA